ncbi:NurA domain-containing protein [Seinonella peptonophila]|uniref:NurA domain-containing protein n=1 Tax=Seinonella peptonophila TaxID=112248 RepID=A0A1M4YLE1_9BACL|nr:DNA double-strand break repair nuclease NurA [Seinonella peptonophila]SHF06352.1 NurA domain-containing protein [Seinonella peptonophila]
MLPISKELKEKLREINRSLREVYPTQAMNRQQARRKLSELGTFYAVEAWSPEEAKEWLGDRTMIGVDGSVNSTPGSPLRTISVFQALAKGTKGEEKWMADVQTPLLPNFLGFQEGQAAREAQERGALLSALELQVASYAIEHWKPRVVMMDGSLLHFMIDDHEKWNQLMRDAERENALLIGVAEEINTHRLVQEIAPEFPTWTDRDLLYGVLKQGEVFIWEDWSPAGSQLWKVAMRTASSPIPIGIDGLKSQEDAISMIFQLVYSLTPKQGRGIPYWLDIVDHQVRVTNPLVSTMIEEYIDPDIRHHLLMLKRNDRMI